MSMKLKWPYVRNSVKNNFEYLLDTEFQKNWFDPNYKHNFWDSLLYYVFDYLFNSTISFLEEADDAINVALYNQEEADVISSYLKFFDNTFEGDMPDSYYVAHPEWQKL